MVSGGALVFRPVGFDAQPLDGTEQRGQVDAAVAVADAHIPDPAIRGILDGNGVPADFGEVSAVRGMGKFEGELRFRLR